MPAPAPAEIAPVTPPTNAVTSRFSEIGLPSTALLIILVPVPAATPQTTSVATVTPILAPVVVTMPDVII